MKVFKSFLVAIILCFGLVSCIDDNSNNTKIQINNDDVNYSLHDLDIQNSDGDVIKISMVRAEVERLIGEPPKEGTKMAYPAVSYTDIDIMYVDDQVFDLVASNNWQLSNGLKVGDSKQKVLDTYKIGDYDFFGDGSYSIRFKQLENNALEMLPDIHSVIDQEEAKNFVENNPDWNDFDYQLQFFMMESDAISDGDKMIVNRIAISKNIAKLSDLSPEESLYSLDDLHIKNSKEDILTLSMTQDEIESFVGKPPKQNTKMAYPAVSYNGLDVMYAEDPNDESDKDVAINFVVKNDWQLLNGLKPGDSKQKVLDTYKIGDYDFFRNGSLSIRFRILEDDYLEMSPSIHSVNSPEEANKFLENNPDWDYFDYSIEFRMVKSIDDLENVIIDSISILKNLDANNESDPEEYIYSFDELDVINQNDDTIKLSMTKEIIDEMIGEPSREENREYALQDTLFDYVFSSYNNIDISYLDEKAFQILINENWMIGSGLRVGDSEQKLHYTYNLGDYDFFGDGSYSIRFKQLDYYRLERVPDIHSVKNPKEAEDFIAENPDWDDFDYCINFYMADDTQNAGKMAISRISVSKNVNKVQEHDEYMLYPFDYISIQHPGGYVVRPYMTRVEVEEMLGESDASESFANYDNMAIKYENKQVLYLNIYPYELDNQWSLASGLKVGDSLQTLLDIYNISKEEFLKVRVEDGRFPLSFVEAKDGQLRKLPQNPQEESILDIENPKWKNFQHFIFFSIDDDTETISDITILYNLAD